MLATARDEGIREAAANAAVPPNEWPRRLLNVIFFFILLAVDLKALVILDLVNGNLKTVSMQKLQE